MAKFIPVEPEKWAEMVKALAENARLKAEVERLTFDPLTYLDDQGEWMPRHIHLAAVERLKAEVERLTHLANQSEFYRSQLQKDTCRLDNIQMQDAFKHYEAENARLKAEVEELTHDANEADQQYEHAISRVRRLEAEVERLTKLCQATSPDGFIHIRDINAAKEGKPQS